MRMPDRSVRCFSEPDPERPGRWRARCVDLDLWASGNTDAEARRSLHDAVEVYLETVLDTQDRESIPALLRRGSLLEILRWQAASALERAKLRAGEHRYREALPYRALHGAAA